MVPSAGFAGEELRRLVAFSSVKFSSAQLLGCSGSDVVTLWALLSGPIRVGVGVWANADSALPKLALSRQERLFIAIWPPAISLAARRRCGNLMMITMTTSWLAFAQISRAVMEK